MADFELTPEAIRDLLSEAQRRLLDEVYSDGEAVVLMGGRRRSAKVLEGYGLATLEGRKIELTDLGRQLAEDA